MTAEGTSDVTVVEMLEAARETDTVLMTCRQYLILRKVVTTAHATVTTLVSPTVSWL